jgi:tetratricopeptide (TPR) repeat protein
VRYVLAGSVRRSGKKIRVTAQLIDAETDAHLWAERFDGDTADLFALQDQITSRIAVALNIQLVAAEAARQIENPDALDYWLRGRAMLARPVTRDNRAEMIRLFERALALDPGFVEAQSWLANALASSVMIGWADSPATNLARAEGLVRQALAAFPQSPSAHIARADVLRAQRRFAEAVSEYEVVIATNRNATYALFGLAQCKLVLGSIEETIPLVEQAIRLSPRDPCVGLWYTQIGFVHLLRSRIDDAILWFEKARTAMLEHPSPRGGLAAAYALRGDTERAAIELAEARGLPGGDRYSSIARLRTVAYFGAPKLRALFEAAYFEGLRKAGVPEG